MLISDPGFGDSVTIGTTTYNNVVAVIDFENLTSFTGITSPGADKPASNLGITTPYTGPVAFVYSYNGTPLTASTGLPTTYQTGNPYDITVSQEAYAPTSGQGGAGTFNSKPASYDLVVSTPEPSVIALLVTMLGMLGMVGLGVLRRRGETE
jgi:hypothetical protein